jgi:tetratricopeptide (TPR) repeat protein
MRSFVSSLFMALALALASGPAVLGQIENISNRYGSIEGHLMPASGENDLPRMVTVRLIGQGFQKVTFATGGRFYFNEVPAGNYMLVASSEGRKDAVINLAGWAPHSSDPMISLVLGPRLREELPPGDPVVSVETLRIPEKAQREFHKGLEFLQKDELQKAEKHLLKALEIYPEYFQAYNNLGVLSMRLNRPDKAEENFEKAIEISPESIIAQKNLGFVRLAAGEPEEAISPLGTAVNLDSEDASAHAYLAEAYFLNEEVDKAKEHFQRALLLDPKLAYPNYRMGHIALEEAKYAQALKYFRQFLALDPAQGREEVEPIVAELEQHFKDFMARTPAG